jgi:hypothetical protein
VTWTPCAGHSQARTGSGSLREPAMWAGITGAWLRRASSAAPHCGARPRCRAAQVTSPSGKIASALPSCRQRRARRTAERSWPFRATRMEPAQRNSQRSTGLSKDSAACRKTSGRPDLPIRKAGSARLGWLAITMTGPVGGTAGPLRVQSCHVRAKAPNTRGSSHWNHLRAVQPPTTLSATPPTAVIAHTAVAPRFSARSWRDCRPLLQASWPKVLDASAVPNTATAPFPLPRPTGPAFAGKIFAPANQPGGR